MGICRRAAQGERHAPPGTYRYRVRLSQSGDGVRLTLSDPAGALPLAVARLTIAHAASKRGFAIDPATEHALRFAGGAGTTVAPGKAVVTMPGAFPVVAGTDFIVSITTSAPSTMTVASSGFPAAFGKDATDMKARRLRPFLSLVAVRNPPAACTIVALGDSITEGVHGAGTSWPGSLADRFIAAQPGRHCSVVDEGIGGNRLLREGRGASALARFDRDVAAVPGVTDVILLEGINDIGRSKAPGQSKVTADDLIAGYKAIIAKAHARHIRVIGATLTPSYGSNYVPLDLEPIRVAVNQWIRTSGAFDGVIDFDAALRDGGTPPRMKAGYNSGDHLHPNAAGYAAMAEAIPLSLFPPR